jgi:hypothetical protein
MNTRRIALIAGLLSSLACQSAHLYDRDDPAIIDAAVRFRQSSGYQIYKVLDTGSPVILEYEISEDEAPPDIAASLKRRNRRTPPIPPSRSYGYALTHILSWDVLRLSLPGYSRDRTAAAIYVDGTCDYESCQTGGILNLRRQSGAWVVLESSTAAMRCDAASSLRFNFELHTDGSEHIGDRFRRRSVLQLLEKWMREAKINDFFEGTGQINRLIIARSSSRRIGKYVQLQSHL